MRKHRNLNEIIYNSILDLMLSGTFLPDQRLQFADLAKKFKVSRTPVNIALSMLARDGFLGFEPDRGYQVRRLGGKEAQHYAAIKSSLENGFLAQAVENLSDIDLGAIHRHLLDCEQHCRQRHEAQALLCDIHFHQAIFAPLKNPELLATYRRLCHLLLIGHRVDFASLIDASAMVQEHRLIFSALEARDTEMVLDLAQSHWFLHPQVQRSERKRGATARVEQAVVHGLSSPALLQ